MWLPRYAIIAVLITGFLFTLWQQTITYQALTLTLATPEWVTPSFDFRYLVGIGIPLFIVTMTSQNLPGVATLRASGYHSQPISPVITSTGGLTLLLAPFGGFTFNLAAITAAICASDECHTDKNKRYIAGVSAGIFNIIAGIFGATVIALFAMFPHALVAALAGLALLGTIGLSLNNAVESIEFREPALITLLVTASGVTFFEIASAFWGILLGMLALLLSRKAT
jgi:benzoate membrane transport protein